MLNCPKSQERFSSAMSASLNSSKLAPCDVTYILGCMVFEPGVDLDIFGRHDKCTMCATNYLVCYWGEAPWSTNIRSTISTMRNETVYLRSIKSGDAANPAPVGTNINGQVCPEVALRIEKRRVRSVGCLCVAVCLRRFFGVCLSSRNSTARNCQNLPKFRFPPLRFSASVDTH